MMFLPDGTLLLTTGDGFVHREEAQRLDNLLGKVVRLNDDGSIPADNPFVGTAGRDEIWTYGHRNPQGLALAPGVAGEPPTVYLHEHGPRGGDELNRLETRAQLRLAARHLRHRLQWRGDLAVQRICRHRATAAALDAVHRSGRHGVVRRRPLSPTGGAICSLRLLVFDTIERIDLENGRVVGQERMFEEIGERLRDIRVWAERASLHPHGFAAGPDRSRRSGAVRCRACELCIPAWVGGPMAHASPAPCCCQV